MNTPTEPSTLSFSQISNAGKAKLLDMAFMPFLVGISAIPVCALALIIWAYELQKSIAGLVTWACLYVAAAIAIHWLTGRYKLQRLQATEEVVVAQWLPLVNYIALAHAVGLTLPLYWVAGEYPFDFVLLYYVVIAAIMAAYATHLTTLLKAFQCLFYPAWGLLMATTPWTFPEHWHVILPLQAAFAFSIHKHALIGHQFFLKQIVLEENEARLAENYRQAKEEAEAALQAKNHFLTTASHDLRQPIHAMGFLIESIVGRNQDQSLVPSLLTLKHSMRAVTQMLNSLLDLSKIESGAVQVDITTVALNKLLHDIANVFSEEARSRQLDFRLRLAPEPVAVNADAILLRQAIVNLIQNALRYTQHGGVLVATRKRGKDWQIEVWDTGIGIALADQTRIHSPFFRNEHAWNLDNAGHGLGLAVVARCAELMQATHGFSSREGQGSKFWLRLPAAQTESNELAALQNHTIAQTHAELRLNHLTGTCLIIDDEPQVCAAWEALLNSWGVQIKHGSSALDAFAILKSGFQPDAILCDQRLRAGESGFELLQELLKICPNAHGAMVSGEFNSAALIAAENEGYLVLVKPIEPELLHTVLSRWLPASN